MAFETFENSVEDSQPVELYTIAQGLMLWRYTSSDGSIVIDGETFLPLAISRDSVGQSQEEQDRALIITLPGDTPICRFYIASAPGEMATVKVERFQIPDGGTPERIIMFEGLIQSVAFEQQGAVGKLAVQGLIAAFSRPVPKDTYSAVCNHILYDGRCTVVEALFRVTKEVLSVSGNTLTIADLDLESDGFYTAGFIEITGDNPDHRVILDHVGEVVTVTLPFAINPTGIDVNVFAGCDHAAVTCKQKFSNLLFFGGFPFVPTKNPFATGLK